ncbi:MAG: hypothetical protein AAF827_08715 [Cyanobacteria bacterium P01_D01_bin.6]
MTHNKRNSLSIDALEKQILQNLSEENLKEIRVSGGGDVCDECGYRLSSKDFNQFHPFLKSLV